MNDQDFERREKARQDAIFDAQFADEPTSDVEYADEPPCKTGSQCTNKCQRCGEINPAEIHTCSPNYVDRRQWKYDPMTGEPLVDGWPLYSGLPEPKPVAWMYNGNLHEFDPSDWANGKVIPLYISPPQRDFKFSTIDEAKQPAPVPAGRPQLTHDESRFADAFTTLIKAGYGKEAEIVLKCKPAWQKLTDEEESQCRANANASHYRHVNSIRGQQLSPADDWEWHLIRAIEAKLKEKNT